MTLVAGLDHLVALALPVFLGEARDIGSLDDIDKFRRLSLRIKHAQGLKNRRAVGGPLLVFWKRQANGQESPCRADFMVAILHVAGLAGGRRGIGGEAVFPLRIVAYALLRGRMLFPVVTIVLQRGHYAVH